MKIIISLYIFLHVSLYAIDSFDYEVTAILHSEVKQMNQKTTTKKDTNSFSSFYSNLLINYDFNEDISLYLGSKTNSVIYEDKYSNPVNLYRKLSSDEISKVIASEISINYDNGFFSFSLGRQEIDFDWLHGSIDGVLTMLGSDDSYSLRLFWFNNYTHLQYNYYAQIKDINANKGMYGSILKTNFGATELSYFNYYVEDLRNIMGGHFNYIYKNIGFNISYTSTKALSLALYDYDEEFFNSSIEFLIAKHFFELGFSQTGENGLLATLQMGNFTFGQFYLNNQVDRENANNGFLKYIYADTKWRFELIGGMTKYDNSFIEIQNDMSSYELDVYLKYNYSNALSLNLGLMYMDIYERDPIEVDQRSIIFNVVVNYENY